MKRGDLYRVRKLGSRDPKRQRVFLVVSRQVLIDSPFSTVICAPVHSSHAGLSTQVAVGIDEGFEHHSSIHCDESIRLLEFVPTDFVGSLAWDGMGRVDLVLAIALDSM